ncbi:MAG: hypothetical protein ABII93_04620 [Chrysiogenia bacterium]
MGSNFRAALITLSRALPAVLFRAGIFIAGGFLVIIFFAMLLIALRLAGGVSQSVVIAVLVLAVLGGWGCSRVLQRFFLFRHRAALLLLFSDRPTMAPGLSVAIQEVGRFFPDHSSWALMNRDLRRALSAFYNEDSDFPLHPDSTSGGSFSGAFERLTNMTLAQAVLALAFSRASTEPSRSVREGLALYFRHGLGSQRLARRWHWFSIGGLAFLFLCLAIPNWFFFTSTGTPVEIGIVLAAAIAWLLHQAFVQPFVLAGVSGALLAETRGHTPDPESCEKLTTFFPDAALAAER